MCHSQRRLIFFAWFVRARRAKRATDAIWKYLDRTRSSCAQGECFATQHNSFLTDARAGGVVKSSHVVEISFRWRLSVRATLVVGRHNVVHSDHELRNRYVSQ